MNTFHLKQWTEILVNEALDFVKVASTLDLKPGSAMAVDVKGKTVALFNVAGKICAIDNTCLHQGGPLAEGTLAGDIVTCPWHQWEYNVCTGANVGAARFAESQSWARGGHLAAVRP